jgi:hypothetical protein
VWLVSSFSGGGPYLSSRCSYSTISPYHNACEPPYLLLGDVQGPSHGYPVAADGSGTVRGWATAAEDVAAGWMQLLAIPINALEAAPYNLFLHGEALASVQVALDACPLCVLSAVVDRTLPCPPYADGAAPPPPSVSPTSTVPPSLPPPLPPSLSPPPPPPPSASAGPGPPAEEAATPTARAGQLGVSSGANGAAPAAIAFALLSAALWGVI